MALLGAWPLRVQGAGTQLPDRQPASGVILTNETILDDLARARDAGDAARVTELEDLLITRNRGLVGTMVRRTIKRRPIYPHTEEDLMAAGWDGLLHAIRSYDATRGAKLSTHAFNWIRQRILRAIDTTGAVVSYPAHMSHLRHAAQRLARTLGRRPTPEELRAAVPKLTVATAAEALAPCPRALQMDHRTQDFLKADGSRFELADIDLNEDDADDDDTFAVLDALRDETPLGTYPADDALERRVAELVRTREDERERQRAPRQAARNIRECPGRPRPFVVIARSKYWGCFATLAEAIARRDVVRADLGLPAVD